MCILSVKMVAEAVPKLPQGFAGSKDLRTEATTGAGPVRNQSKKALRKETAT